MIENTGRPLSRIYRDLSSAEMESRAMAIAGNASSLLVALSLSNLSEQGALLRARELLEEGSDLVQYELGSGEALRLAISEGLDSVALELISHSSLEALEKTGDGKLAGGGVTALSWAARTGSMPLTRALIQAGARPHAAGMDRDDNPLAEAVEAERWDIAKELLDAGAQWGHLNPYGAPIVVELCERSQSSKDFDKLARMIVGMASLGADLSARRGDRVSALHLLAREGYGGRGNWEGRKRALSAALIGGADAKALDQNGRSPIGCAMSSPALKGVGREAVALLLAYGADPCAKDDRGVAPSSFQAPYDECGKEEVEAWLEAREIASASEVKDTNTRRNLDSAPSPPNKKKARL